jgi:NTP pyrophosphatase (non-canonical NTP hydrolase)
MLCAEHAVVPPAPGRKLRPPVEPDGAERSITMTQLNRTSTLPEIQQYVQEMLVARNLVLPLKDVVLHMTEELGEVTRAIRKNDAENLREELADCLFFVLSAANAAGVDLTTALLAKEERNRVRFGA